MCIGRVDLEQRCQLLITELSEMRQSLTTEQQQRSQAEDLLRQAHEQLQLQQQLTTSRSTPDLVILLLLLLLLMEFDAHHIHCIRCSRPYLLLLTNLIFVLRMSSVN